MKSRILAMAAILMVLMATVGVAIAQAPQGESAGGELKGKRLLHRYHVVFRQAEQLRIGMEAVIGYVNELGNDSTKLVEIKNNYVAKVGELKKAAEGNDFQGFQGALADLRRLSKEFRDESHRVLGNKVGEAQTRVAKAIQDNKAYLNSLVGEINKAREDLELEAIDKAVEAAKEKTDKAKEQGANVSEIQAKLDEIRQKRGELKAKMDAAIATCSGVELSKCNTTEAQAYKAVRQEIKEDFKELRDIARNTGLRNRIAKGITAAKRILENARDRLTAAEERGADVAVVKAKLDEVERLINSAQEKLGAKDYKGAVDELKAARTAFVSAMKEIRELRRTERQEKAMEKGEGKPNSTKGAERAAGRGE